MRYSILLFLLLPVLVLSNVEIHFRVISFDSKKPIENVILNLSRMSGNTDEDGKCEFTFYSVDQLKDTLYIEHNEFHFEQIPLAGHKKYFVEDVVIFEIKGYPRIDRVIHVESMTGRIDSYEIDTTFQLELYSDLNEGEIEYIKFPTYSHAYTRTDKNLLEHEKINWEGTNRSLGYTMLSRPKESFKLDWFQPNYVHHKKSNAYIYEQQQLLRNHFLTLKKNKAQYEKKITELEWEMYDLYDKVDSLIAVIEKRPQDVHPVEEEELEVPYINHIDYTRAEFSGGDEYLQLKLQNALVGLETEYKGKIVLWLNIDKKGRSNIIKSISSSPFEDIIKELDKEVFKYLWTPAKINRKFIEQKIIIVIDLKKLQIQ